MIKWPGLYMPPINLWNVPRVESEMILNKSDTCRYCGGQKMVRWSMVDYRQAPWEEWRAPNDSPADNEIQQCGAVNVACSECGLVYDRDSLMTPVY